LCSGVSDPSGIYPPENWRGPNRNLFGLTSLTVQKANPEQVLSHVRRQWSIENRSHYVRDMAFDEDRAQIRKGKGPQMMACLRNFAISLLRLTKVKNISKAL
jgi:predicted transposase YbfD/YdcC